MARRTRRSGRASGATTAEHLFETGLLFLKFGALLRSQNLLSFFDGFFPGFAVFLGQLLEFLGKKGADPVVFGLLVGTEELADFGFAFFFQGLALFVAAAPLAGHDLGPDLADLLFLLWSEIKFGAEERRGPGGGLATLGHQPAGDSAEGETDGKAQRDGQRQAFHGWVSLDRSRMIQAARPVSGFSAAVGSRAAISQSAAGSEEAEVGCSRADHRPTARRITAATAERVPTR